jgi:hypothetical protein
MGKIKNELLGDTAPSRTPYMDIGRFRLTALSAISGKVWIRDLESGEAGAFDVEKLEAKIREFYAKEF